MHGRELLVHEADLLSGIAGQIRNQVTIFMKPKIRAVTSIRALNPYLIALGTLSKVVLGRVTK
jgi:hypothetical protein